MFAFRQIKHILDTPELQESVILIALATGQIDASMNEGTNSVDKLIDGFKSMSTKAKKLIKENPDDTDLRELRRVIDQSIIAFQFYDRLCQRLDHVSESLVMLSKLVSDESMLDEPAEWDELKNKIRQTYSMQSEHDLFKLIHDKGMSIEEALENTKHTNPPEIEEDDIEIF